MEELQLSDTLQRYFSDVFVCCNDDENAGMASLAKTIELIRTGNIPDDIISQIADICWQQNNNTTTISRKQFFSALKLVAAYQANILPISGELLLTNLELPMPRFTWSTIDECESVSSATIIRPTSSNLIELNADLMLPSGDYSHAAAADAVSTDSEIDSDTLSVAKNESPEVSSTASDSPTPTNSVHQDRSWGVAGTWHHGLVSEEQRQLLGTEEESSDKHSSEEDTEVSNEIWTINPEQRDYYTNQFRSLQPDTNALLAGSVARMFFEKSRLPVHELRKIWQLADVTKDGALSLHEFNTAMHLVVLRRNHIELPDTLPNTLMPSNNNHNNDTPLSGSPETEPIQSLSPSMQHGKDTTAKEWTKFVDSPTSSMSSPGPKPVNFDFQKITLDNKDAKILHPVALRLTPECSINNNNNHQSTTTIVDGLDQLIENNNRLESHSPKRFIETNNLITVSAIQRPQPKKINLPGPGAIPPPPPTSQCGGDDGPVSLPVFPPPKKEKPPPPPPRPFKTHGRSSSLDLNRLTKLGAPPTVPPRISPNVQQQSTKKLINQRSEGDCGGVSTHLDEFSVNFDDFVETYENVPEEGIFPGDIYEAERKKLFAKFTQNDLPIRKHGAFEVYRKPVTTTVVNPNQLSPSTNNSDDKVKWELFQKLQEENTVLLRICQELSQELADVREEKIALKVKLERQTNLGC